MSEHYCVYKDDMCELDVDEAYQQGRADGYSQAENDYHKQTEKDRQSSYDCGYEQGRADIIKELKSKADCDLCYECAMADANLDCMLGLKEQKLIVMNENNKLEYPDYCDEDVRCDEVCDGTGCPYLNEDGECNIANAMAYREYKNQKLAKEQKNG